MVAQRERPDREEQVMDTTRKIPRTLVLAAVAVGVGAGSYGIASAATGSGSPATTTATVPWVAAPAHGGGPPGQGWGTQRSDETPLTGDALAKVTAIAKEKVPGGTVVRVETDADGHAAYEAHMTSSSGAPVTVYVDKSFNYVSTETRP
jgi:Peptidase propeptide and YPEB domain